MYASTHNCILSLLCSLHDDYFLLLSEDTNWFSGYVEIESHISYSKTRVFT